MNDSALKTAAKPIEELDSVVVRFAGDSGDGMQLAGTQLTGTSALAGNDVATFPDFPAEIRAPKGTLAGVSGFQVQFAVPRYLHAGRPGRCPRRDEPRRPRAEPALPQSPGHPRR